MSLIITRLHLRSPFWTFREEPGKKTWWSRDYLAVYFRAEDHFTPYVALKTGKVQFANEVTFVFPCNVSKENAVILERLLDILVPVYHRLLGVPTLKKYFKEFFFLIWWEFCSSEKMTQRVVKFRLFRSVLPRQSFLFLCVQHLKRKSFISWTCLGFKRIIMFSAYISCLLFRGHLPRFFFRSESHLFNVALS